MSKVDILVEVKKVQESAFAFHATAVESESESQQQAEALVKDLSGYGLDVLADMPPVPMFSEKTVHDQEGFAAFSSVEENPDVSSETFVIAAQIDSSKLADLEAEKDITVWPNSKLELYPPMDDGVTAESAFSHPFDLARSGGGLDCRPFKPAVTIDVIRDLLGVEAIWRDGFRGQNIVVGIIDEGVNGQVYPVVGGFSKPNAPLPGSADITSHGSMCAADILVAAPATKIYDYPFLGIPNSGGALGMFQAVLNQRRIDGTPHLTSNSYGFVGRPPKEIFPNHEVWNINHPVHRKVLEVIASGVPTFFAAGNCGAECPSANCQSSGIGPGISIHASNSLKEVITVAAVNSRHERIGYSSQGPGGFEDKKPDIAAYSHFFGNFGPGRPAGGTKFDSGTSAATPVAAGVGALLMSAFPGLKVEDLRRALVARATDIGKPGWDSNTGYGIINAATAYAFLKHFLRY